MSYRIWGSALRFRAGVVIVCIMASTAPVARAETLSMPTGPASLHGLGSGFSAGSATGTGEFSIPLEVPPGFVAPALSLDYASGSGRDVLGLSFELPFTSIYRSTQRGAPTFDENDRFAVEGDLRGELICVNAALGYYRLKDQGANVLFVRDRSADAWEIRHPDGTRELLGTGFESQQKSSGHTFRWYLASERDPFGHRAEYRYVRDRNRIYLDRIDYQLEAPTSQRNHILFSYESRPDPYVDYSSGEAVLTARRLHAIQTLHGERMIRSYRFKYEDGLLFSLLQSVTTEGEHGLTSPPLTFGYYHFERNPAPERSMFNAPPLDGLRDGTATFEDVNQDGLDDLLVGLPSDWHYYENLDGQVWATTPKKLTGAPHRGLYEADVLLADMDGDGDRDVVESFDGAFRYYPALEVRDGVFLGFGRPTKLGCSEGGFSLRDANVRLSDLDGDGRMDALMQKPGSDVALINTGERLESKSVPELPTDAVLDEEGVEITDFNGDGLEDVVRIDLGFGRNSARVWYGYGRGRFAPPFDIRSVPVGSQEEFTLQDLNNDAQVDLVRTSGSWATYYLNDGTGSFTGPQAQYQGLPGEVETQQRLFADLNGNGTTDLVWVTNEGELVTLDLVGQAFHGLLHTIDNGMGGVTTLTYRSSTDFLVADKRKGRRWHTTLPTPIPVVAAIETTDSLDMLGFAAQRSHVTYRYADGYYDGARRVFRAFGEVETIEPGDVYQPGLLTRSLFHVGKDLETGEEQAGLAARAYAVFEHELDQAGTAGKLYGTQETKWELRGLCRDAGAERDFFPRCDSGESRDTLRVPLEVETLIGSWEGTDRPRYSGTRNVYNAWGDLIGSESYGEVTFSTKRTPGDPVSFQRANLFVGEDEYYSESDLLYDTKGWRIGLPYATRMLSAQKEVLAQSRSFFDGPSFVGLELGRVDVGLVTRSQVWLAEESRWIDAERVAYNGDGQVVASLDATGVRNEVDYDPATGLFAVRQRWFSHGQPVEVHAEYDTAFGHVLRTIEPNGETRSVNYDGLGRVREVIDPSGDVVSTYEYDEATSKRPLSIVSRGTLRRRGDERYDMSYAYVDAYGRARQVKQQADDLGYVASGWVDLSVRGATVRAYQPFASKTLGLEPVPGATPFTLAHYDALGRLVRVDLTPTVDAPKGGQVFTEYLPFEVHTFSERASNDLGAAYPLETRFDGQGRAVQQTRYNLDERGQLQALTWSQEYDSLGRVVRFRDPAWHVSLPGTAERARHERRYDYDGLGRLTHLYDANLGTLDYSYDDAGRPLTRTDALGQVRRVEYDYASAARPVAQYFEHDAGGAANYAYYLYYDKADEAGPLPDATGLTGRLAWVEHPTGSVHMSYDVNGRPERAVTTLWDPGRSSFAHQARDTFTRSLTYNPQGAPVKVELPGGLDVALEYDTRGLLRAVSADFGAASRTLYDRAKYDALGTLVSVDQGNGTRTCNAHDARGRRTQVLTGPLAGTDCSALASPQAFRHLRYQYTYDNLLASITDLSKAKPGTVRLGQSFRYDWLQQLTHVDATRGSYDYSYNLTQNLTSQRASAGVKGLSLGFFQYGQGTDGPNRLTSFCEDAACQSGENFAYDAIGRLERYAGYNLSYDAQNRLVRAHKEGVSQVEYYYDHGGERVLAIHKPEGKPARVIRTPCDGYQERDGEKVWTLAGPEGEAEVTKSQGLRVDLYLLDQLNQHVASGGAGPKPLAQEYLDLDGDGHGFDIGDLAIAKEAYESDTRAGGEREVWRWVHADPLVTASHVSDSFGALVHEAVFHPYGVEAEWTGVPGIHGYAGGEREEDVELGLQRFGARYYAPDLGRWITPDEWIGEAPERMWGRIMESGLYGYVGNNPVNFNDPTGQAKADGKKARRAVYHPYSRHGQKKAAQKRFGTSGATHQSEHTIGYAVLSDGHLPRGESAAARALENGALAYQEAYSFHRDHIGTGSRGTPDSSGFTAQTYRATQRSLLEDGDLAGAVQINQLAYAFQPGFQDLNSDGLVRADRSFREMARYGTAVDYATGAAQIVHVQVTPSDRAQMLLARQAARDGVWPVELAGKSIVDILAHFAGSP